MSDSHVYVRCNNHHWVPARVVETKGDKAVVSIPQYTDEQSILSDGGRGAIKFNRCEINLGDYANGVLPLQNVDEMGWLNNEQDMVDLPFLHEAGILFNLKSRHVRGKPYTRTGDILIAVNPYEWIHDLYTPEKRREYASKLLWNAEPGSDPRKFIEPHVYETSTLSYKGLAEGVNQSILVSGESGAGKTETVKICMNHIAMIQNGDNFNGDTEISKVVERVVQSNPLLEAFGNAKTSRNDNSSRFGKYLQLQFSSGLKALSTFDDKNAAWRDAKLVGSQSEIYLLEKSRVIHHDESERNFHIFYQLLSSSDSVKGQFWTQLKGKNCESFRYVGRSSTNAIEGKSDKDHFQDTIAALALVGIEGDKLMTLMQSIAAVLQLGNVSFTGCEDKSSVSNRKDLQHLAELTGLPPIKLEECLTTRTMKARGEVVKVNLNVNDAQEARDSLAKAVYNEAFIWLVREINQATKAHSTESSSELGIIGLLDIFGFECFKKNGFEQLCINYANERLQHKFTEDIFRQVQEEYKFEGLALNDIRYDDNHEVLDLIESRMGLLAMLNEECVRPGGCDKEFVYKAIQQNKASTALVVGKRHSPFEFGIRHYAGEVLYTAGSFVTKNNDTLPDDMRKCAGQSSNQIIAGVLGAADAVTEKTSRINTRRNTSTIAAATVWTKYKSGLHSLMDELRKTQSRYIRCIKPNESKKPAVMQHGPTLDQLRSAGVIAAVTITRSAFPNRLAHMSVLERFRHLSRNGKVCIADLSDLRDEVEKLLCPLFKELDKGSQKSYAVGLTRTYFRAGALELLEAERIKGFDPAAATIQKVARGFLVRKRRNNEYICNRHAATIIQKLARVKLAMKYVARVRDAKINAAQLNKAATTINAIARGVVRRMHFKHELKRFREVNSMKVELQQLQDMIKQSEAEKEEAIKAAEARVRAAMDMIHDERSQSSGSSAEAHETTRKLDAKNKEIEKMRSDNKRVRANIKLLEGKYKRLNEELKKKQDFNEKETERFMALNHEAKAISDQNAKETENQEIWKKQAFALVAELNRMNEAFVEIRKTREQYQKAMTDILRMLRTRSKQEQLIEDSIFIALESDAEVKALGASFDAVQAHLEEKQNGGKPLPKAIRNNRAEQTESTELDVTSQHSGLSAGGSSFSGSLPDIDEEDLDAEAALMAAELEELSNEVGI